MCTRANTLHNGVEILNKFQLDEKRAAQLMIPRERQWKRFGARKVDERFGGHDTA